jgi:hypothetical protein
VKRLIDEEGQQLQNLTSLVVKGGVDDEVAQSIQDCKPDHRAQFDNLLGKLSQLHGKDLSTMDELFNECSSFYPQREFVMYMKLKREYQAYSEHVDLLKQIDRRANLNDYKLDSWSKLIGMEKKRSDLSFELVAVQGEIIAALLHNVAISSKDMQALLSKGQEARNSLSLLFTQMSELEKEIQAP